MPQQVEKQQHDIDLYPERQVVVISGDGAFGFNAMELDTCVRHQARVLFVIANNRAWNIERMRFMLDHRRDLRRNLRGFRVYRRNGPLDKQL